MHHSYAEMSLTRYISFGRRAIKAGPLPFSSKKADWRFTNGTDLWRKETFVKALPRFTQLLFNFVIAFIEPEQLILRPCFCIHLSNKFDRHQSQPNMVDMAITGYHGDTWASESYALPQS